MEREGENGFGGSTCRHGHGECVALCCFLVNKNTRYLIFESQVLCNFFKIFFMYLFLLLFFDLQIWYIPIILDLHSFYIYIYIRGELHSLFLRICVLAIYFPPPELWQPALEFNLYSLICNRQKCKINPLTFTIFYFSPLTFSFVNSVL